MIVKQIHNNKIGAYTLMLLLVILLWLKPVFKGLTLDVVSFEHAMPLWKLFAFAKFSRWIGFALGLVSTIIITLSITRFNSRYALLNKPTALSGYIFVLLVTAFPETQLFNPYYLVSILFIVGLEYLFSAYNYRKAMKECFVAALWISTSSLVDYKVLALFPLIFMVMAILRLLNFKTFLASVIGIVLPWLFLMGYLLVFGNLNDFLNYLKPDLSKLYSVYHYTMLSTSMLISVGFLLVISLFSVMGAYGTKKIFTRKQYQVFILMAVYITVFIVITGLNFKAFPLFGVSFAIVCAHLVDSIRSPFWQNMVIVFAMLITLTGQILL